MRGAFTDAVPNEAHASAYSEFLDGTQLASSHACGSCHDIVNGQNAHIERTFEEWQKTVFNAPMKGRTCPVPRKLVPPELIADGPKAPGVFVRLDTTTRWRPLTGHHRVSRDRSAERGHPRELNPPRAPDGFVRRHGSAARIAVLVDNLAAGHRCPSGAAQDRQLWFESRLMRASKQIYQSGVVSMARTQT